MKAIFFNGSCEKVDTIMEISSPPLNQITIPEVKEGYTAEKTYELKAHDEEIAAYVYKETRYIY